MKVLLDTNIVLDYLGANQGFTEDAEKVFDLATKRKDIKHCKTTPTEGKMILHCGRFFHPSISNRPWGLTYDQVKKYTSYMNRSLEKAVLLCTLPNIMDKHLKIWYSIHRKFIIGTTVERLRRKAIGPE